MKNITLCADDYALTPAISEAILELAATHKINAISCMVESPHWETYQPRLSNLPSTVEIGLHLNLTEPFPDTETETIEYWIKQSLLGNIHSETIYQTFREQWHTFCQTHKKQPDFIDGHQHIHTFPHIRKQLLRLLQNQKIAPESLYIRNTHTQVSPKKTFIKSTLLKLLARNFSKDIHPYTTNTHFAGIYNFQKNQDYAELIKKWLDRSPDGTLIMCHPGLENSEHTDLYDPIAKARHKEYLALSARPPLSRD